MEEIDARRGRRIYVIILALGAIVALLATGKPHLALCVVSDTGQLSLGSSPDGTPTNALQLHNRNMHCLMLSLCSIAGQTWQIELSKPRCETTGPSSAADTAHAKDPKPTGSTVAPRLQCRQAMADFGGVLFGPVPRLTLDP